MRKYTLPELKNFLSWSFLTGGFTLITSGCWSIFGQGVGQVVGGVLFVALHVYVNSD
jgi:hypothetical protein